QMDNMKPLITTTTVEVEGKGRDSYDADNRCNLLLCTNHKDGVIKTANDRRYAIVYTGQQCMEDRARDGMDDAYFTRLWYWLENGGFAACADYFDRYNITVNVMGNAPRTTATDDAIAQTMGGAEQCIMEALELERFGFVCGMIRSDALDAMLAERGYKLSPHKRKAALETIGYVPHPVNQQSQVKIAGRPVKVYVKRGHLSAQLAGVDIAARLGTIPENAMADAAVIFSK
ncbi:MAG: primase-helicase family protein, partial [Aeromonas veronii]